MNITTRSTKAELRSYIEQLNAQLVAQGRELEWLRNERATQRPVGAAPATRAKQFMKQGELWEKYPVNAQRGIYGYWRVTQ